jgi:protein O-mannosyl-transferase
MKTTVLSSTLVCLCLTAITVAAFWGVQKCEFVNYDDEDYVFGNSHIQHGFTNESIRWAFTEGHASNWHPITWLSHMLDYKLFGLDSGKHHVVNLLIHLLNVLLLFWILKDTTGAIWKSAVAACLFAIHPLRVESVAWVAERKDVLSAMFWMLTTLAYVRYSRRPGAVRYFLVLVLFVWGLMSKAMLVTLPFVLLLMDYWPLDRLQENAQTSRAKSQADQKGSKKSSPVHLLREKIPLFLLAAVASVITYIVQQKGGATEYRLPLDTRVANAAISYLAYIKKMVWPNGLAPFYPHPEDAISFEFAIAASILLLIVSILAIRFGRKYKYLPVGWFWYLGTLVPVIGIIQVGGQAYADRYTYIPMTGLFIAVVWLVPQLVSNWKHKKEVLCFLSFIVVLGLSICTYIQQQYWRDTITLFEHALSVTENNYVAHYVIADPLRTKGRLKEAVDHYSQSLRIQPNGRYRALNGMGLALIDLGEFDEAIKNLKMALNIKPDSYEVHTNLGIALSKKGRFDEAIAEFREALRHSDTPRLHSNFAYALQQKGEKDAAIEEYNKALAAAPSDELVHYAVGILLAGQGKNDQAAEHFRTILRLKPDFAEAHNSLGDILAQEGKFDLAAREYEQALTSQPDNCITHTCLGIVLFKLGRMQEAVEHFNRALLINPDYALAQNALLAISRGTVTSVPNSRRK